MMMTPEPDQGLPPPASHHGRLKQPTGVTPPDTTPHSGPVPDRPPTAEPRRQRAQPLRNSLGYVRQRRPCVRVLHCSRGAPSSSRRRIPAKRGRRARSARLVSRSECSQRDESSAPERIRGSGGTSPAPPRRVPSTSADRRKPVGQWAATAHRSAEWAATAVAHRKLELCR
jgi:hypothetical protein